MSEATDAADRLEVAFDPDKRGGWSRIVGDEIVDLRLVIAAVRSIEARADADRSAAH